MTIKENRIDTSKIQKNVKNYFTTIAQQIYANCAFAKSEAEPGNSNDLSTANSTPKACFFIRNIRTPKISLVMDLFSMVACNGKGFALCCFPLMTVFQPVIRYRQSLERKAVTSKKFINGVIAMIYKFLLLGEKRLTIRIRANSETEARQRLNLSSTALCVARFNTVGGLYA